MDQLITVAGIGVLGGVLSGFLGIGGGIITAPLFLYVPALLGQPTLSMHAVAGLTITQSLFAGLVGSVVHGRREAIDGKLALPMSIVIFATALMGGAASKFFSHDLLLGVFAALALTAAGLIFLPGRSRGKESYTSGDFSSPGAIGIAAGTGILCGLVGQGGSFLLIPAIVTFLRVPLRVAMGSNLVIVIFASLAGFIGKAATGQIPEMLAVALVAGVAPGSWIGSRLSGRVPTRILELTLGVLILIACARMVWDIVK